MGERADDKLTCSVCGKTRAEGCDDPQGCEAELARRGAVIEGRFPDYCPKCKEVYPQTPFFETCGLCGGKLTFGPALDEKKTRMLLENTAKHLKLTPDQTALVERVCVPPLKPEPCGSCDGVGCPVCRPVPEPACMDCGKTPCACSADDLPKALCPPLNRNLCVVCKKDDGGRGVYHNHECARKNREGMVKHGLADPHPESLRGRLTKKADELAQRAAFKTALEKSSPDAAMGETLGHYLDARADRTLSPEDRAAKLCAELRKSLLTPNAAEIAEAIREAEAVAYARGHEKGFMEATGIEQGKAETVLVAAVGDARGACAKICGGLSKGLGRSPEAQAMRLALGDAAQGIRDLEPATVSEAPSWAKWAAQKLREINAPPVEAEVPVPDTWSARCHHGYFAGKCVDQTCKYYGPPPKKPERERDQLDSQMWEAFDKLSIDRIRVPGGWLFRPSPHEGVAASLLVPLTFVPDPSAKP